MNMGSDTTNKRMTGRNETSPYRVPDGYFSDLNHAIRCRVMEANEAETTYAARGIWGRMRGVAGAAGAFGCLVLLAMAGFYFTGYRAQVKEADEADLLLGYTLYSEDVESLATTLQEGTEDNGALFALEVKEYLSTYGSGTLDNETLLAMATGTEATDY